MAITIGKSFTRPHHAVASILITIAILAKLDATTFSSAFQTNVIGCHRTTGFSCRTQVFSSKTTTDLKTNDDSKTSSMMTLNFVGETVFTSKPAPVTEKSMQDFLTLPESVACLLRGSKGNQVKELGSISADLLKQYEESCVRVNALPPTPEDRFYDVTTSGVKFPGLEVLSVATMGVKITNEDRPGYEFVLIKDSTFGKGNRLFVWFFNKVTGKDKDEKNKESDNEQTTFSLNKISVVPSGNDMISFQTDANLIVQIKFPAFLMRAIPGATPEKFEKSGSDSLLKVLEGDCPKALEAFQQEYMRWMES